MRVGIRVDASSLMGIGHLRRCLSLAEALRTWGAQVRFVTRDLGVDSARQIAAQGFADTVVLDRAELAAGVDGEVTHAAWAQVTQEEDAKQTIAALQGFAPDWTVVDSYSFDARWHDPVRAGLDCRIAQIDDIADRTIAPDLLIDHNLADDHAAKYAGRLTREATILGGPQYALLGPRFATARRYAFAERVQSIGIFMGGADAGNHSATVLDALDDIGFDGAVEIVTTSANPQLDALRERIARGKRTLLSLDLTDLADFFAHHDVQVGAGGGASWERCCIGVPSLLVVTASNQEAVAPQLAAEGVVALARHPDRGAIAAALAEMIRSPDRRRDLAARSRGLVDGRGALRVALRMLSDRLDLRAATSADAERMFDWRNDPATRAVSLEQGEIAWADHVAWLDGVLGDLSRRLFIGEIGPRAVGVIRFDFAAGGRATVSLYLDPALHGLGLGPRLLLAGEEAAGPRIVEASVLRDNRPSQRLFEGCGYERVASERWEKHRG